jgi:hypothetical protein
MIQFSHVRLADGSECVTVYDTATGTLLPATSDHPNFVTILDTVSDPFAVIEDVRDLFDVGRAIVKGFADGPLSARVAVEDDTILLDGEPIHNSLTVQVLAFLGDGNSDYKPLVRFIEKIESNPNPHSREQLYDWLSAAQGVDGALTIADDGDVIGYKGVNDNLTSITAGPALVNGDPVNGHVPNEVGSTIEMARDGVDHNPARGCSRGLHVGTWGYASTFGPVTLKVKFNPADVVSVPTDCAAQKVRVCRYEVVEVVTEKLSAAVDFGYYADDCDVDGEYGDDDLWL